MSNKIFFKKTDEFFKHNKCVSVVKNYEIMEYTVDLVIGYNVFIDFPKGTPKDVIQQILLANSYNSMEHKLWGTNNYKDVQLNEHDYGNYIVYHNSDYGMYIKVFNKNDLSWISLAYNHYLEQASDGLFNGPGTCSLKNSSELKKCGYED